MGGKANTIKLEANKGPKESPTYGKAKGLAFDDFDHVSYRQKYRICEVKVYRTEKYIVGLMVVYDINGVKKTVGSHLGSENIFFASSIKLAQGEFINKIAFCTGDWIDGIGIFTNKGKELQEGGTGGKTTTVIELPENCCVTAFAGTTDEYLQSVKFYYDQIN